MSEQALDAHLEQWEQCPEEMIEVERGYFEWLEGRVEQLEGEIERLRELSIALYRKIEGSPDVCNLDEFDEWEKALGGE